MSAEKRSPRREPERGENLEGAYLALHGLSDEVVRRKMKEAGLGYVEAVKMLNRERQRRFWSRW